MVTAVGKEDQQVKTKSNNNSTESIKDTYDLLLKEVQIPTLQSIPLDTYQKIATIIGNLKAQGCEGIEAKIRDRMAELICHSAKLLLEIRHQKLIEYQHGESLSSTTPMIDYSKLTDEEKYIFGGEKESEKRKNVVLTATIKGRPKVLESISTNIRSKQIIVRFIKPMERFMGINTAKYGPFQEEDVAVLPFENARSLIENGKAVEIHVTL